MGDYYFFLVCVFLFTFWLSLVAHDLMRLQRELSCLLASLDKCPSGGGSVSAHAPSPLPDAPAPGLYRAGRQEIDASITEHEERFDALAESGLNHPLSHVEAGVYDD